METVAEVKATEAKVEAPIVEAPKEDLITRVSKVKVESPKADVTIEEPKFDINDIEKITDPVAKEQALRAYKSFQRGFNEKYQELATLRKDLETIKNQNTQWTPDRIKQELNKPDFIQASQTVLQEQNPPNSGMNDTEWSSLTVNEKKQWQGMQQELASLKQQQNNQQILQNFKQQDETLKTKYANYDPQAVDVITNELLTGKRLATREDLFRSLDYENAVKRAYELGKQDGNVDKIEKTNASSYDGLSTGKPATDIPVPEKNESTNSFFGRLVENNIRKQKAQR
jgi:hypothetical protein